MPQLFWDASGLTKRYAEETGSETADALFAAPSQLPMLTTYLGYSETCASLRRKRNRGDLAERPFTESRRALRQDVFLSPDFRLLPVDDAAILTGVAYIDRYNLNSSDSVILAVFLRFARASGRTCVLVAADGRLMKAAIAEGQRALSPEVVAAADVPAFLASL